MTVNPAVSSNCLREPMSTISLIRPIDNKGSVCLACTEDELTQIDAMLQRQDQAVHLGVPAFARVMVSRVITADNLRRHRFRRGSSRTSGRRTGRC
jgi:hypothetical protein